MRNFLWEYNGTSKISHLVKWDLVCASKEKGGLGVCNLKQMNQCLLAKWCWRFGQEKNRLWYKIIVDKHGDNFSFQVPNKVQTSHGVSCWKTIADTAQLVSKYSSLNIHSGTSISFWNDVWKGEASLSFIFQPLYKLASTKNSKLADMVTADGNWKFYFKRILNDREAIMFAELLCVIGDIPPALNNIPDTRRWSLNTEVVFTVKSLYSKLMGDSGIDNFPAKFI